MLNVRTPTARSCALSQMSMSLFCSRIDLAVCSIEDHRLARANFEICPPQRVPCVQTQRSPQLRPDAREKFQALLSERHNCPSNSSSVPEHMTSSFCATLPNAGDLSFPCVAQKRPRKHWIQDDTWLSICHTQKQRGLMLKSRRAFRARSMHCAFFGQV